MSHSVSDNGSVRSYFLRAQKFCAYQERCSQEVLKKLTEWGCIGNDAGMVIAKLTDERYLDEDRFAKMFVGGKFRIKRWGRIKIIAELKKRKIPASSIQRALNEINEVSYREVLKKMMAVKAASLRATDPMQRYTSITRYAASKGFEKGLIIELLKKLEQ